MRDHQHPWNLRRIFGRQTVVCVGSPKWPESGIAAQVIPAQSSSWTVRGQGDGFWRLWSWMTIGVPSRALCSGNSSGLSCTFNTNVGGSTSSRVSRTRQAFPSSSNHPSVSSGITAGLHLLRAPLPTGNS